MEDRIDNTTSCDNHASDRVYYAKLALRRDGTLLSLKTRIVDDYGAYLQFGVGQHGNALSQCVGPYRINSVEVDLAAVLTNKCQQGAYRGFGSEVANFVIERLVDAAADELGMDRIALRRQNFIQPDQFPYLIPTGNMYDSGNYEAVLDETLTLADIDGWRAKQAEALAQGRHIGIGVATCQERSVFSATEFWMWNLEPGVEWTSAPDGVSVKIDPTGKAFVTLHSPFWGNSPETVAAQVLAEQLTIDPRDIEITYSDTDQGLNSTGPGGSRFTVMVTGAIVGAAGKIREKMFRIAAHLMEADVRDLALRGRRGARQGRARHEDEHRRARRQGALLPAQHARRPRPHQRPRRDLRLRPPGDHAARRRRAAHGNLLSDHGPQLPHPGGRGGYRDRPGALPPLRRGPRLRHHGEPHDAGGAHQGRHGERHRHRALRGVLYDEAGQLTTALWTDYLIPTVKESPVDIAVGHVETPSPFTEYGVKGGGEGGRMGGPPAIAAAIEDALRPLGVTIDSLPLPPSRLRALIREAQAKQG